jgi:hypothetical protein
MLVDTAAQDGLIGRPALLRLMQALRTKGLKCKWKPIEDKKPAVSGIGGKANVIGTVIIPLGVAGTNGLAELTVVSGDIPGLLPIGLIKLLKSLLDFESVQMKVKLGDYSGKTKLHELSSGHASIDVTEFAPGGWKFEADPNKPYLSASDFVLPGSNSFKSASTTSRASFLSSQTNAEPSCPRQQASDASSCARTSKATKGISTSHQSMATTPRQSLHTS